MCTNLQLEWTEKYGPQRGQTKRCWFKFGDPKVGVLCRKYKATVIGRK